MLRDNAFKFAGIWDFGMLPRQIFQTYDVITMQLTTRLTIFWDTNSVLKLSGELGDLTPQLFS